MFIFVSGLVYFLIMAVWLNLVLVFGMIKWVRLLIGLMALLAGGWSLRSWWKNREGGCEVVGEEKRQKLFSRFKAVTSKQSLVLATLGIAVVAVGMNLIELACSAGLPAVYAQVLALNQLPRLNYYLYILVYIVFFMLDDLVVFVIAMITLRAIGIESKFSRWSKLIGGVVMFLIGASLLFKPELLSF